jgi:GH35 family endo-1,4-beta-xylanase
MKRYKNLFSLIALGAVLGSCVDDAVLPFKVEKPESIAQYEYLDAYDVLKSYVDRTKYPNFKLGTGITVSDFNSKGVAYGLATTNYDELTAGSAMKYASCISDNGAMNFTAVQKFVETAQAAGVSIYGHTLAWHAQQNNKYLNSLIADKPLVFDPEAPNASWWENLVQNSDCEGADVSSFFATDQTGGPKAATFGAAGTGADGTGRAIIVQSVDNPAQDHSTQFFIKVNRNFAANEKIRFSMKVKADKNATIDSQAHNNPGGYVHYAFVGSPNITTEWQEYTLTTSVPGEVGTNTINTIAFNLNKSKVATTYYFDDIKWEIEQVNTGIPLTPEEKKDTLTWAMENWVKGMMEACGGYVTAWDAVNEALSGTDKDADGMYDLQSATRGTVSTEDAANNFYWQDYLGDEDYVRTVIRLARRYFAESGGNPSDLKLFVNDYNLESDWDDNGKMKSMLKWVRRWEADGVTKIDGIGTQMHVSCYMDPQTQQSKEKHIVQMFELLASSGKLIKISELDMGIVDASGADVKTENITLEQEKAMSDFYTFIVQKYLEIIPAAQQYGITHWSPTDSPAGSGWRAGSPIGLWNMNYSRKPAYAGFADGLGGK